MKKEYPFIFAVCLILLAYAIDFISGPISLSLKNPYHFFDPILLAKYPLTTLGIFVRSIGLFILVWLLFSFIKGLHFKKTISLIVIIVLANLYSIQQVATGQKITTLQWNLSIAYASTLLIIPTIIYLFKGLISLVRPTPTPPPPTEEQDTDLSS